jgi:EmrB/QacA subfamily drug resistance transporter
MALLEAAPAPHPARARVFTAALIVLALASLDGNVVGPALPRIVSDLGGLSQLSWVVTAFAVASTAATPLYGRLSDRFGRKAGLAAAILIFVVGSMFCGAAHAMHGLIAARALQGVGAGGLIMLAQTSVADVIPPRERPRYQGYMTGVFGVSSVAGPLIGGAITDWLSWPWIFYVNLPVGAIALGMILTTPSTSRPAASRRFDFLGFGLTIAATCTLLLALSWGGAVFPWFSPVILGLGGFTVLAAGMLVVVEHRVPEPAIPPHLLAEPVIGRAILAISLTIVAMFAGLVFVPLFFQLVHNASATEAGLRTAPIMAGVIAASVLGGRAVSRTGKMKPFPLAGLALSTLTFALMAWLMHRGGDVNLFDGLLVLLGGGLGLVMPNLTTAIQNAAPAHEMGVAMATTSFFRSLGGAFGVAVAGMLLSLGIRSVHLPQGVDAAQAGLSQLQGLPAAQHATVILAYADAIGLIFAVCAVVSAATFFIVLTIPERPLRTTL